MKHLLSLLSLLLVSITVNSQSLTRLLPDEDPSPIESCVIHTNGNGYAVGQCGIMLVTKDGGMTWSEIAPNIGDNGVFGKVILMDPNDHLKAVYKSAYDLFWTSDGFNTVQDIKPIGLAGLISDFIALPDGTWVLSGGSMYTSKDKGQTWTIFPDSDVSGISMHYSKGALFLGHTQLFRSTDNAETFQVVFEPPNDRIRKVIRLGDKLIAGSLQNKLYESSDDGDSWQLIDAQNYFGYADNLNVINEDVLISTSSNRINYSKDGGLTWSTEVMPPGVTRTRSLFVDEADRIFVTGEGAQIHFAPDINTPITLVNGYITEYQDIEIVNNQIIALGNDGMLAVSTDEGATWQKISVDSEPYAIELLGDQIIVLTNDQKVKILNPSTYTMADVAFPTQTPGELFADAGVAYITSRDELYKSSDGLLWQLVHTSSESIDLIRFGTNGDIYRPIEGYKVIKSSDGGSTWSEFISLDQSEYVRDIGINDEGNLGILTSRYLYFVDGDGNINATENKPYNGVRVLWLNEDELLCMGTNGSSSSLYKNDKGDTKMKTVDNVCVGLSYNIHYVPSNNTIYFGGKGGSIYKAEVIISSSEDVSFNRTERDFAYPNPSNGVLYISAKSEAKASYIIYNMQGQIIYEDFDATTINISHQPSGTYILKSVSAEGTAMQIISKY